MDIEINAIFDKDGKNITMEYIKNDESKSNANNDAADSELNTAKLDSIATQIQTLTNVVQQLQQKMNDIELRMDEEQKNDDGARIDKIEKQIKIIEQNVNKLLLNNIDPETQKLKSWLEDKVGLPQYVDTFIESGIDDLSTASLLTMDTIKGMGIDKIGHQMKILNQISKLKQNDNRPIANEGGTAYI